MNKKIEIKKIIMKPAVIAVIIWSLCTGAYMASMAWLYSEKSPENPGQTFAYQPPAPAPMPGMPAMSWFYPPEDIYKPQKPEELGVIPDGDYVEGPSGWYYFKDGSPFDSNVHFYNLWNDMWYFSSASKVSSWLKVGYSQKYLLWYNNSFNIWFETGNSGFLPAEIEADPPFDSHADSRWSYIFDLDGFYNNETFEFTFGSFVKDDWFGVTDSLWYNKSELYWSDINPADIFVIGLPEEVLPPEFPELVLPDKDSPTETLAPEETPVPTETLPPEETPVPTETPPPEETPVPSEEPGTDENIVVDPSNLDLTNSSNIHEDSNTTSQDDGSESESQSNDNGSADLSSTSDSGA